MNSVVRTALVSALALMACAASNAETYRISFEAGDFWGTWRPPQSSTPPFSTFTGEFLVDIEPDHYGLLPLLASSVQRDGEAFLLPVGVAKFGTGLQAGALVNGFNGYQFGSDDFYFHIKYSFDQGQPVIVSKTMTYTSTHGPALWTARTLDVTMTAVPEPGTVVLFALGLGVCGLIRKKAIA